MLLSDIIAQPKALEAVHIALSSPYPCSLLILGGLGTGKSAILSAIQSLSLGRQVITLPSTLSIEALGEQSDIEQTLQTGHLVHQQSLEQRLLGAIVLIDNCNMMAPDVLARLLDIQANSPQTQPICLIAAVNTIEGALRSSLLDRFDMSVELSQLSNPLTRVQILRQVIRNLSTPIATDHDTALRLNAYRESCRHIAMKDYDYNLSAEICRSASVLGHRADIALLRAATVYASMQERSTLVTEDFTAIKDLVLAHRLTNTKYPDEAQGNTQSDDEIVPNGLTTNEGGNNSPAETSPQSTLGQSEEQPEQSNEGSTRGVIPEQREDIGQLKLKSDPITQLSRQSRQYAGFGSRLRSLMSNPQGRYYKPTSLSPSPLYRVSLLATIREAIPYQRQRRQREMSDLALIIKPNDLRYKLCRRRTGYHILFAVDASGSMGAKRRMHRVKGLIIELLRRAYEERDYVGLLTFQGDEATLRLPLTQSISRAYRLLQELPTGGRTPLYLGLKQSLEILKHLLKKKKHISPVLVLVTDGRATSRYAGENTPEALQALGVELRKLGTKIIVIDSEEGFIRINKAKTLAQHLVTDAYYTMDELIQQGEKIIKQDLRI